MIDTPLPVKGCIPSSTNAGLDANVLVDIVACLHHGIDVREVQDIFIILIDYLLQNKENPCRIANALEVQKGSSNSCSRPSPAPFALALREPSGGHCVGLSGKKESLIRWGPFGPPRGGRKKRHIKTRFSPANLRRRERSKQAYTIGPGRYTFEFFHIILTG